MIQAAFSYRAAGEVSARMWFANSNFVPSGQVIVPLDSEFRVEDMDGRVLATAVPTVDPADASIVTATLPISLSRDHPYRFVVILQPDGEEAVRRDYVMQAVR